MNRLLLFLLFFIVHSIGYSQQLIKGKVIDAESRSVIAGASIYINNSSLGTSSNKEGAFSLNTSNNIFELVITNMGYDKQIIQVQLPLEKELLIQLKQKSTAIEEVVVRNYLKDGWKEWGNFFVENLIGIGDFADECEILNPEVVKFHFNKKENVLVAVCTEPIIIRNKALGYELTYDLANFNMNFSTKMFFFEGYAFFKDLGKGRSKYRKNREDAYMLSMNRFVSSTYHKSWAKDGYIVRKLVKKENEVRVNARKKYAEIKKTVDRDFNGNWKLFYASQKEFSEDQVNTLNKQMIQHEKISYLMGVMQPEEIIVNEDKERMLKEVLYQDYLYIIFPSSFEKSNRKLLKKAASQVSELFLAEPEGVIIESQGSYFPTSNWILSGYAVGYSKLAYLLPLDYQVSE